MVDAPVADLLAVDRDVARGVGLLARWRADLARDPEGAAGLEPLESVRRVTGKSAYDALGDLAVSAVDGPQRDGLRAWVVALLLARVVRDDDVAWAREANDPRGKYAGDPPERVTWKTAWRSLPAARTAGDARLWFDAACEVAPRLAGVARERAAKRLEAARRLGLAHPWDALVPGRHAELRAAAEKLLRSTDDLAAAVMRSVVREGGGPAAVIHSAVGRDAGEGWPGRLTARWVDEAFRGRPAGLKPVIAALPAALGASSFARALAAFGFALRGAAVARATPFALGHEPGHRAAHRLGFVFGSLAADVTWQEHVLGVGRRTAMAQVRVVARAMLFTARLDAARLLLGDEADFAPRDGFSELGARVFGSALDDRLRGAWPTARDDEPSRFLARIEAPGMADGLRDRFDADWFRNPRAWNHLHAVSALALPEPIDGATLDAAAEGTARRFEAVLG
jgi:hypothetical protein